MSIKIVRFEQSRDTNNFGQFRDSILAVLSVVGYIINISCPPPTPAPFSEVLNKRTGALIYATQNWAQSAFN